MAESRQHRFETIALHGGQQVDPATMSRGVPVHRTSSYLFKSVEHAANLFALKELGNIYTRLMNPTHDVLEQRVSLLEGGAASVAALIGNPLVGATFVLELGRRRRVPLSLPRLAAAVAGALVGWGLNRAFDLRLIRLNVPEIAPGGFLEAIVAALLVGAVTGTITSLTGSAIYRARGWQSPPVFKLAAGGLVVAGAGLLIAAIATPAAAFGPGTNAAAWAESPGIGALTLLGVALLRAAATTAAVAAGGCGGLFVPFLAIGDIAGRAFAPAIGVPSDLAGAAGAAGGIAGGYRLPFTALALVVGLGGPETATLTCLATVLIATAAGVGAGLALDRLEALRGAVMARLAS